MKVNLVSPVVALAACLVLVPSVRAQPAATAGAATAGAATGAAAPAHAELRTVYHVSDAASIRDALANATNQLAVAPTSKIVVIANSRGVTALRRADGNRPEAFEEAIRNLESRGVRFVACELSMKKNNMDQALLMPGVETTASGVVELSRLMAQEGYAYIKP